MVSVQVLDNKRKPATGSTSVPPFDRSANRVKISRRFSSVDSRSLKQAEPCLFDGRDVFSMFFCMYTNWV